MHYLFAIKASTVHRVWLLQGESASQSKFHTTIGKPARMLGYRIMPAKIIFMLSILDCRVLLPAWVSEEALANDSRRRSILLTS